MTSLGDASSAVFSMYSHPMTRASSITENTEPLVTPMDEIPVNRNPKHNVVGPRTRSHDPVTEVHSGVSGLRSARTDTRERDGPYFSLPRVPIQRHSSTKQLINRYESITNTASPTRKPPSSAAAASMVDSYFSNKVAKRRPSFGNSLRNLLSVFKKGKGPNKEKDQGEVNQLSRYRTQALESDSSFLRLPVISNEIVDVTTNSASYVTNPNPSYLAHDSACLLSGTLLYLSRIPGPSSASVLPVWMTCTVSLYSTHFLITWLTLQGNPSTHIISLLSCTDVRSLALNEIDANEKVLLPKANQDGTKIFEILFEGKPREKFAAAFVQERAKWISAIWDAILRTRDQSQEGLAATCGSEISGDLMVKTNLPPLPNASEYTASVYTPSSDVGLDSTSLHISPERTLPPTPIERTPTQETPQFPPRISLYDRAVSRPYESPGLSASQLSSSSRARSPSISNLGQRSVVKQRLAAIERNGLSAIGITSTIGAPLQRAGTSKSHRVRAAFSEIERMQRDEGVIVFSDIGTPRPIQNIVSPSPNVCSPKGDTRPGYCGYKASQYQPLVYPPVIQEDAPVLSPISQYSERITIEPNLAPLVELIQGNSAKHYDQTAGLGEQIISLQQDIHNLPKELESLISTVSQTITPMDTHKAINPAPLEGILLKVESILKQTSSDVGTLQANSMIKTLENLQGQLKSDLPVVLAKLDAIENNTLAAAAAHANAVLSNLHPEDDIPHEKELVQIPSIDLSDIYAKLDELTSLCNAPKAELSNSEQNVEVIKGKAIDALARESDPGQHLSDKLQEILAYLSTNEAQRKLQLEQQADSVRYLNELNTWLDAFVNNGTSQIQTISNAVDQLCRTLGCNNVEEQDGQATGNLMNDMRQIITLRKDQEQSNEGVRLSVHSLIGIVQEYLNQSVHVQHNLGSDSIMQLIDRQRHDQEQMLRALSSELTNEIRGERLRFVEAMKEATAINVQAHVEQFKAELTREVMVMTQEVGHLHKERQALEQQIADLFAFYSKQKHDDENDSRRAQTLPSRSQGQVERSRGLQNVKNIPASGRRRPLPAPGY